MTGRALVLGGGGITGIAWELGMLAELRARGVDLTTAELVVGTSAGSVVGAQVATEVDVEQRYQAQLEPPSSEIPARLGPTTMVRFAVATLATRDPQRARARIGQVALATRTVPAADRVAVIADRLPVHAWPDRALKITAVDADSGALVVLDRDSGVPLVEAVAASCAVPGVWPPVVTGGRRLVDGGVRSAANIDLAAGAATVVVLAPMVRGMGPIEAAAPQVAALRAAGAVVELVSPDEAARAAMGRNALDPAFRAAAAVAGRRQAPAVADRLAAVWRS